MRYEKETKRRGQPASLDYQLVPPQFLNDLFIGRHAQQRQSEDSGLRN